MSGSNGIDPMVVDEDQAAQMLGISRRMVFEFRSKGELQYVKLGRLIRYHANDRVMHDPIAERCGSHRSAFRFVYLKVMIISG